MSYIIEGYSPPSLFRFFEDISGIPRSSGKEKAISNFLVSFGQARGLTVYQDKLFNVILKKSGSQGCEGLPPVVLQGHTDMVCEKNADTPHDFDNEGVHLQIKDGMLSAKGTTLGADNGVAVALMLALLDDETLIHPPLECVFTVQEETGLAGASSIDSSQIHGRTMINLDSEEEGVATVSCAGGLRLRLKRNLQWEQGGKTGLAISVRGLLGGHSGMDIVSERGNANKLLARLLYALYPQISYRLVSLDGGSKDNAIPRESDSIILLDSQADLDYAIERLNKEAQEIAGELSAEENGFYVDIKPITVEKSLSEETTAQIVRLLFLAPNGVRKSNHEMGGFVVCSLNIGVVKLTEETLSITFSLRSSVASLQQQTKRELCLLAEIFSFTSQVDSEYPGWSYAQSSKIREVFQECYREQAGKELKIEAIHAGLECGLFCEKLEGLDAIAVGPDIHCCHTPQEKMDLASCERFYKLITAVLKRLTSAL